MKIAPAALGVAVYAAELFDREAAHLDTVGSDAATEGATWLRSLAIDLRSRIDEWREESWPKEGDTLAAGKAQTHGYGEAKR